MTELSGLIAKAGGERPDGRPPSQADILVMLAEAAELFHTPDEIGYADIEINGHRETWAIKSSWVPALAEAALFRGAGERADQRGDRHGDRRRRRESST